MKEKVVKFIKGYLQGLWEGGSVGTSVRDPEGQEGACESMEGPITLAIDVLLSFFLLLREYFLLFLVYLEK